MLSPICLFTYNRLLETKQTVEALQHNFLALESELFIFSDAAKAEGNQQKVVDVRNYLRTVSGFKKVEIIESPVNKGLANSIIQGVTTIINKYEKVIVLEDDLITTPNFLDFMNQSLDFYAKNNKIFSIAGYSMDLPALKTYNKDFYSSFRASSWGWATWKDRWEAIDWQMNDYSQFKWNLKAQISFMRGGSDLPYMLWKQMHGKIDSWAVRWCYNQFKRDLLTVYPTKSKVESIGFGAAATHTKKTKRFFVVPDQEHKVNFIFENKTDINEQLYLEFKNKFSVITRLKDRF
jgi:hypothetical protein